MKINLNNCMFFSVTLRKYVTLVIFSVMIALIKASPFLSTVYHNVRDIILLEEVILIIISLIPVSITILITVIPYIYIKLIRSFIESFIYVILVAITWVFFIIPIIIYLDLDINIHIPGTAALLSCLMSYELISTLNPYNIGKALYNCFYREKMFIDVKDLPNDKSKLPFDINKLPNFTMMNDDSNQAGSSKDNDTPEKNKRKRKADTTLWSERLRKRGRPVNLPEQRPVTPDLPEQRPVTPDLPEQTPIVESSVEQRPVSDKVLGKRRATDDLGEQRLVSGRALGKRRATENLVEKNLKSCLRKPEDSLNEKPTKKVKFADTQQIQVYYPLEPHDDNNAQDTYNPYPGIINRYPTVFDRHDRKDVYNPYPGIITKYPTLIDVYNKRRTILATYTRRIKEPDYQSWENFIKFRATGSLSEPPKNPLQPIQLPENLELKIYKDISQFEERLKFKRRSVEDLLREESLKSKKLRLEIASDPQITGGPTSRWTKIAPKGTEHLELQPVSHLSKYKQQLASSLSEPKEQATSSLSKSSKKGKSIFSKSQIDLVNAMSEEQFNAIKDLTKSDIDIMTEALVKVKIYGEERVVTKRSIEPEIYLSKTSIYSQDRTKALDMIQNTNQEILSLDRYDPITPLTIEQKDALFNLPYPFENIDEDCLEYKDKIMSNAEPPIPFTFKYQQDMTKPWLDTNYIKPYILDIPIVEDYEASNEVVESFKFTRSLYNANCRHMSMWAGFWFEIIKHLPEEAKRFPRDTYYKVWWESDTYIKNRVDAAYVLENVRAMVVDHREKCKFALIEMYARDGENDYDLYESIYNTNKVTLRDLGINDISGNTIDNCFSNLVRYFIGTEYSVDQDISEAMIFRIKLRG